MPHMQVIKSRFFIAPSLGWSEGRGEKIRDLAVEKEVVRAVEERVRQPKKDSSAELVVRVVAESWPAGVVLCW